MDHGRFRANVSPPAALTELYFRSAGKAIACTSETSVSFNRPIADARWEMVRAYGVDAQCVAGGVACLTQGIEQGIRGRKCKHKERHSVKDSAK